MSSEISIRCFLSHLAYLLYNKESCVLSILWNTQDFVIYFFRKQSIRQALFCLADCPHSEHSHAFTDSLVQHHSMKTVSFKQIAKCLCKRRLTGNH